MARNITVLLVSLVDEKFANRKELATILFAYFCEIFDAALISHMLCQWRTIIHKCTASH